MVTIGSNTVVHAACGAQYTMAVTARGRLYAWGDNSYGQLGLGTQKEEVVYNRRVTKCVACPAVVRAWSPHWAAPQMGAGYQVALEARSGGIPHAAALRRV